MGAEENMGLMQILDYASRNDEQHERPDAFGEVCEAGHVRVLALPWRCQRSCRGQGATTSLKRPPCRWRRS